jgi:hypothetical protein
MTAAGRRLALLLVAVVIGAVIVTLVEGAPSRLPGVALGSPVLLHAERAGAIAAIVVALASILTQAARGRRPPAPDRRPPRGNRSARNPRARGRAKLDFLVRWRPTPQQPATPAPKPVRCFGCCANATLEAASVCCDTPPTSAASPRSYAQPAARSPCSSQNGLSPGCARARVATNPASQSAAGGKRSARKPGRIALEPRSSICGRDLQRRLSRPSLATVAAGRLVGETRPARR